MTDEITKITEPLASDAEKLLKLMVEAHSTATSISTNTDVSVELIDGCQDQIEELILFRREKFEKERELEQKELDILVSTFQNIQETISKIRTTFTSPRPVQVKE